MLVLAERENVADIVAYLAEVDRRNLPESRSYPSLYQFLIEEYHYGAGSAYRKFRAARAAKYHPSVLVMLRSGELQLDVVAQLQPYLREHGEDLLDRAKGKTSREVETMLAGLDPSRLTRDTVRVINALPPILPLEPPGLPLATPNGTAPPPGPPPAAAEAAPPAAPAAGGFLKVRFSFTADSELWTLVRRAREILRHKYPGGRLESIFKDALRALLDRKDPDRRLLAQPPRPAPPPPATSGDARYIPQPVKDAVWRRDGGCCVFRSEEDKVCGSKDGLEYDHVQPWALGGTSNDPANVRLLCRAHNQLMAKRHGLAPKPGRA